jgi:hypothetical protein
VVIRKSDQKVFTQSVALVIIIQRLDFFNSKTNLRIDEYISRYSQ